MEKMQQFMENNYWTTTISYSNIKIKYILTK